MRGEGGEGRVRRSIREILIDHGFRPLPFPSAPQPPQTSFHPARPFRALLCPRPPPSPPSPLTTFCSPSDLPSARSDPPASPPPVDGSSRSTEACESEAARSSGSEAGSNTRGRSGEAFSRARGGGRGGSSVAGASEEEAGSTARGNSDNDDEASGPRLFESLLSVSAGTGDGPVPESSPGVTVRGLGEGRLSPASRGRARKDGKPRGRRFFSDVPLWGGGSRETKGRVRRDKPEVTRGFDSTGRRDQ